MSYDPPTGTVIYRSKMHPGAEAQLPGDARGRVAGAARAAWTRLIRKVYEADPLQCPKCKGPMRVIALIDDPPVVQRILEHLGCWAPEAARRVRPPPSSGPPKRSSP